MLLEHRNRVDRVAATGMDLDVQVRAGGVAGGAGVAEDLTGIDLVAGGDGEAALVAVPDLGAVLQRDDRAVAVGALVAGGGTVPAATDTMVDPDGPDMSSPVCMPLDHSELRAPNRAERR